MDKPREVTDAEIRERFLPSDKADESREAERPVEIITQPDGEAQ